MEILNCPCGREHYCAVESVIAGVGAAQKGLQLARERKKCLAVGDENTLAALTAVGVSLDGACADLVVFPGSLLLLPDEKAITRIERALDDSFDTIIGVGGGTVNDLCKYIAHKHSLYYIYVATAPSMDGYASDGAALILEGMKVTLKTSPPKVIVCDSDILCKAPPELIRAGVGDILGKFSCLNDWLLAAYIKGEYICDSIYDEVYYCAQRVADNIEDILKGERTAVELLTHALVQVGVYMSYAGSSRPASGSEHHLAHFFEIYAIEQGRKHQPHGIDVGQGSYYTALLRDKLLETDLSFSFKLDKEGHYKKVKALFPKAGEGMVALQEKVNYHQNSNGNYDPDRIRAILKKAPTAAQTKAMLDKAGLYPEGLTEFYGKDTVKAAMRYGKELKDRFTVLWLYEYYGWEILEI